MPLYCLREARATSARQMKRIHDTDAEIKHVGRKALNPYPGSPGSRVVGACAFSKLDLVKSRGGEGGWSYGNARGV